MSVDIKDYFLAIPIKELKQMRVKYHYLLLDMCQRYDLDALVSKDDYIYIQIQKEMPRLKQAAILAYEYLKRYLLIYRYNLIYSTIRLQYYKTKPIKFCLHVDNFRIKYYSKEDTKHLCNAIGVNYCYTADYKGKTIKD